LSLHIGSSGPPGQSSETTEVRLISEPARKKKLRAAIPPGRFSEEGFIGFAV
jgi:hypothetical protein